MGQDLFAFTGPPNSGCDPVQHLAHATVAAHAMLVRRDLLSTRHFNQLSDFDHLIAICAFRGRRPLVPAHGDHPFQGMATSVARGVRGHR